MMDVIQPFMSVESCRSYIDELYSPDEQKVLSAAIRLKNAVIGSNRQKGSVIMQGVVPKLIQILGDNSLSSELRTQAAIIIGSLTKGSQEHVQELIKLGILPVTLNALRPSNDPRLTETCLRVISSVCTSRATNCALELIFADRKTISMLLSLALQSVSNQISVTQILAVAIKTPSDQNMVCEEGGVPLLATLLCSPHFPVLISTLKFVASLSHQNPNVSLDIVNASFDGKSVPDLLVQLMARDQPSQMQLIAAKCITFLHRASAIPATDPKVMFKTLPCLVCLSKAQYDWATRVTAVETLAYLTEVDSKLQEVASISNHLIPTLANFLHYKPAGSSPTEVEHISRELRAAAFMAFASLGANDEDIRKKIIETENLMGAVVAGLQDAEPKVRLSAIRCLHSLSRSVQQLRTTFQDHSVWKPLMELLKGASDDILSVASSTLCNLLLEFSPSKEPMLESGAVDLLCNLTRRCDPALRLNGTWALMNMAFQAEQKIKLQILNSLGTDQIFRLLQDPELEILMKTLGLLRNLLSTKPHIDHIMGLHGAAIMHAVLYVLEGSSDLAVKEQALCILANIGDGDTAKNFLIHNEEVLKKIKDYMTNKNVKVQVAAIFCITNLIWKDEPGSLERQMRLKEFGIDKLLHALIQTSDTFLWEKVKTALAQFSD
uniref:Armadillo repeat-containing protein 8 n=4 Tax=Cacopsylla melanoneura TaxID=428564 RepID=A0A8D8ZJE1_9HEMI